MHARDARKAGRRHARLGNRWRVPPEPGSWDLLVNCTPIGMHPRIDVSPMPAASLSRGVVYDLILQPGDDAPAARCRHGRLRYPSAASTC